MVVDINEGHSDLKIGLANMKLSMIYAKIFKVKDLFSIVIIGAKDKASLCWSPQFRHEKLVFVISPIDLLVQRRNINISLVCTPISRLHKWSNPSNN